MRAITVSSFGGPEVLEVADIAIPEPGAGQVRLRVDAASINPVDLDTREGRFGTGPAPDRPLVLGWDAAGVIDSTGPGVAGFDLGQPVYGWNYWFSRPEGTQAEYAVLDAGAIAPQPSTATAVEATTFPVNGNTAAQALRILDLPSGATLIVVGAAGMLGGFAVQLAVAAGLRVLAVASERDEAFVTACGAEFVSRQDNPLHAIHAITPGGAHGLFDTAGAGATLAPALTDGGVFVSAVGEIPHTRDIRIRGLNAHPDGTELARLTTLVDTHQLTLRVADTFTYEQVRQAHQRAARPGSRGRIVLVP